MHSNSYLMEELLIQLSQATNPDPSVQIKVAEYTNSQIQNHDFGNLLFQILDSKNKEKIPTHYLSLCCNLLRLWARIQWSQLESSEKSQCFNKLKSIILADHPVVIDVATAFIDIANQSLRIKNSTDNFECYEMHMFDFFNKISSNPSPDQLFGLIHIIYFLSRRYKTKSQYVMNTEENDISLIFTRISNVIIPVFENETLLETPPGCDILIKSLSIFKVFFFRLFNKKMTHLFLKADKQLINLLAMALLEKGLIPIRFAQKVLIMFSSQNISHFRLVSYCCHFLNSLYKFFIRNHSYSLISAENDNFSIFFTSTEEILKLNFSILAVAIQISNENTFLIPSILKIFETYRKFLPKEPGIVNVFLQSLRLTQIDDDELSNNPNLFYLNVYDKYSNSSVPTSIQISKGLICDLMRKTPEFILYLMSLPQEEHVIRCISYCLQSMNFETFSEPLRQYFGSLLDFSNNCLPLICSKLNFIRNFLPFLTKEEMNQIMLMIVQTFFQLFASSANDEKKIQANGLIIVTFFAVKLFKGLLKHDIQPFSIEFTLNTLIQFHPYCFKSTAINAIQLMAMKFGGEILPFCEIILEKVAVSFDIAFTQYFESNGDPNQIEEATAAISSNLSLCSLLIDMSIKNKTTEFVTKPFLLTVIQTIFENDITDCNDDFVRFLSSLFSTTSMIIQPISMTWLNYYSSQEWFGFIDQLIEPFLALISHSPESFNSLQVSDKLEEICLSKFIESDISNTIFHFSTLLSWICLIDPSFDPSPEQQCISLICDDCCHSIVSSGDSFFEENSDRILIFSAMFDLMASLTISRKIIPNDFVLYVMVEYEIKRSWALRIDQKRLYSIFLLNLIILIPSNELSSQFLFLAFKLLNLEIIQTSIGNDKFYQMDENAEFPVELESLTCETLNFRSPQENINITELLTLVFPKFPQEFIPTLKNQFPNVFQIYVK